MINIIRRYIFKIIHTYVEEIISVKYDRCYVRIIIMNALGPHCHCSQHIEQNTLSISEVVHNQVKIGYQLVQYIRESETNL